MRHLTFSRPLPRACVTFEAFLPELSQLGGEGEIPAELRLDLHAHALSCERCAGELAAYRRVVALVRALPGARRAAAGDLALYPRRE